MNLKIAAAICLACSAFSVHARAQQAPSAGPGFYAGPILGGGFGNSRKDFVQSHQGSTGNFDVDGVVGGATAGANWQEGRAVFGINGTVLGSGLNGTTHRPNNNYDYITANHWLVLLDPRFGWQVLPGVVPYVTGGFAVGDIEVHTTGNPASPTPGRLGVNYTRTEPGWNAGAGVQISLASRWTLDAQYLHVRLSDADVPSDVDTPTKTSFNANLFTGALEYRF